MKQALLSLVFVCALALAAPAQNVKVIQCAPACNMARKTVHKHVLSRVAGVSPSLAVRRAAHGLRFVVRHPLATLKDIF